MLDYREQLKDRAQTEMARIQAELMREKGRAAEIAAMLENQEAALHGAALSSPGERWLLEHYVRGLRADLASTTMRVRLLSQNFEEARQALIQRAKEHRVLEKLKEKRAETYAHEERWKEQKSYDETASLRFKATPF